jgi:hypothetical protein
MTGVCLVIGTGVDPLPARRAAVAYIANMERWQAAIANHVDALVCEILRGPCRSYDVHESFEGILELTGSFGRRT